MKLVPVTTSAMSRLASARAYRMLVGESVISVEWDSGASLNADFASVMAMQILATL